MVSVPHRVHITPIGYETDRVYLPAVELEAEEVVLVAHTEGNDRAEKCQREVGEALDAKGIDTSTDTCNIFDLNESIETLLRKIYQYEEDDVKVNLSAGSKITAIAGLIACMFTDAEPIYVYPEEYTDDDGIAVSQGMDSIDQLPVYPVTEPDHQLIRILGFIKDTQSEDSYEGASLKEIGDFLLENNLPAVQTSDKEPGEGDKIYATTRSEIIQPLHNQGLITERPIAGTTHIRITEKGEQMFGLGRSLIRPDSGESSITD